MYHFVNEDGVFHEENCGQAAAATLLAYYRLLPTTKEAFLKLEQESKPNWYGTNIDEIDPFFNITDSNLLNNFIGATLYIWGAFYVTFLFIKSGHIFTGSEKINN